MIFTEDEAKNKWCFQDKEGIGTVCIGSRCMAWRWVSKYYNYKGR